jgi:cyanobactin biosynthesis protein (PatB/AcyB/McaB family)
VNMPRQTPPLRRPELIQPHQTVDVEHGDVDDLVRVRMKLLLGANYNDPPPFQAWRVAPPSAGGCDCGCGGTCGCSHH